MKNGIGAAQQRQINEQIQVTCIDFYELYPPKAVVILPPIITPTTGPVTLMIAKLMNTTDSS